MSYAATHTYQGKPVQVLGKSGAWTTYKEGPDSPPTKVRAKAGEFAEIVVEFVNVEIANKENGPIATLPVHPDSVDLLAGQVKRLGGKTRVKKDPPASAALERALEILIGNNKTLLAGLKKGDKVLARDTDKGWVKMTVLNPAPNKNGDLILENEHGGGQVFFPADPELITAAQDAEAAETTKSVVKEEYKRRLLKFKVNGQRIVDCDDTVARMVRGKTLGEIYTLVAHEFAKAGNIQLLGSAASADPKVNFKVVQRRYEKLNNGMQRMNLANLLRIIYPREEEEAEDEEGGEE